MSWFNFKKKNEDTISLRRLGGFSDAELRDADSCACQPAAVTAESLSFAELFARSYSNRSLSAVYACVELISNALSSMPLRVMETDEHGHKQFIRHHPLQRIFNNKNIQTMSVQSIIKNVVQDVLLRGNGYIMIVRGETGLVNSLRYIPASSCSPIYDQYNDKLSYYVTVSDKKKTRYSPKDIIHITKDTRDGISGVPVTTFAKDVIELTKSAEEAARSFFDSNMNVSGILSCKTMMNEKQRQDIKNSWQSSRGRGANSLQILPLGVDYIQLGTDSAKGQLLESRQYQTVEICRYFNVPAQFLQSADKVTYTAGALEQMNLIFFQQTLLPFMISIETEFTRKLFTDDDLIVDMDESEFLMRTDKSTTSSYLTALVGGGIMTVNEARRELGLSEIEDGDGLHIAYSDADKAKIDDGLKDGE